MAEGEWCLRASLGVSYAQALAAVGIGTFISAAMLWIVDRRLPPGHRGRLCAALPIVAANLLLTGLFCRWIDVNSIILISFNMGWLSSFKALSWALGRGALCSQRFTLSQFALVYSLPITPLHSPSHGSTSGGSPSPAPAGSTRRATRSAAKASLASGASDASLTSGGGGGAMLPRRGSRGRLAEDAGGSSTMASNWAVKNALLAAVLVALRHQLPGFLESLAFGLGLFVLLSLIMDGPAALVIGLTGLRISPHFDAPWRSTSVASFWSKRWDLAAGNTLRQLVYDSVLDGSLFPPPPDVPPARPSPLRLALGTAASFAASGLVHEGIFWYLTGHTTGGVWFAFFFVQAPLSIGERWMLDALQRRGIEVPAWLRNAITFVLVISTAQHLFWTPCKWYGVTDAAVESTRRGALAVLAAARRWAPLDGILAVVAG